MNAQKLREENTLPSPSIAPRFEAQITPLVYTVPEAAQALNCSTKTIRRLLKRRLLTGSKALRKILIPRQQIEAFLKATCDVPKNLPHPPTA